MSQLSCYKLINFSDHKWSLKYIPTVTPELTIRFSHILVILALMQWQFLDPNFIFLYNEMIQKPP